MRLTISHTTTYRYEEPVPYGLQELRLRPQTQPGQVVHAWQVNLEGAGHEVFFEDEFANVVELVSMTTDTTEVTITATGEVETNDTAGVVNRHRGYAPLWLFNRSTELTAANTGVNSLLAELPDGTDLHRCHELARLIRDRVSYEPGRTNVTSTAEAALAAGHGVCQDHTHIFLSAARALGLPARYISGYLMMDDRVDQDASHAWASVWIEGLGWVGYDVANGISPDERYVEVASGLDYQAAAPVAGVRFGAGSETLRVSLQVQQ